MMRRIGPILLATLAAYLWGFAYWGASSLPYGAWKQAADDAAAASVLREHFPERGTYFVPGRDHAPETLEALHSAGPVAFVHIASPDGRPLVDPSIMVRGVLLTFVVAVLLALLLQLAGPAFPTYGGRVLFLVSVGVAAAVLIHGGDVVWWVAPVEWKLVQACYDVTVVAVYALVLARFVPGEPAAA